MERELIIDDFPRFSQVCYIDENTGEEVWITVDPQKDYPNLLPVEEE